MSLRAFLALAFATVIAVAAAGMMLFAGNDNPMTREAGTPILPELAAAAKTVTLIKWVRGGETATVKNVDGKWVVEEFSNYPANAQQVDVALLGLTQLQTFEPKTHKPELYDKLDVGDASKPDSKATHIQAFDDAGKEVADLIVGRVKSAMAAQESIYVRRPDEARAWLARGKVELPYNRAGWVNTEVVTIDLPRVREAFLNKPAKGPRIHVFKNNKDERDYTIEGMPADHEVKDIFGAEDIARVVQQLAFEDVRPASEVKVDTKAQPYAEFVTFDGLKIDLWLTEADGKSWATLKASAVKSAPQGKGDKPASADTQQDSAQQGNTDQDAAKDEAAKEKDIAQEVATINDRVGSWVYALPSYEMGNLRKTMDDLIQKKADPEAKTN